MTLEETNRALWISCQQLLLELTKQRHDVRMAELAAARAAEFQRQVMTLAPALINMMAGRDIFPQAQADDALLDAMFEGTTPERLKEFLVHVEAKMPNGDKLAAIIQDRYNRFQEKRAALRAEEERLMEESRADYASGEKDAAGELPHDAIPPGEMNVELWEALKALLLEMPKRETEVRQDERARIAVWLRGLDLLGRYADVREQLAGVIERGDLSKGPTDK